MTKEHCSPIRCLGLEVYVFTKPTMRWAFIFYPDSETAKLQIIRFGGETMKRKKDDLRRLEDETTKMENVKYEVSQEIVLPLP